MLPAKCFSVMTTTHPGSSSTRNFGASAYGLHSSRFNYLFHDGHTEALKLTQTVGKGDLQNPQGMWTVAQGD